MNRTKSRNRRRYIKQPKKHHRIILLRLNEGKIATEIAKELGIKPPALSEHINNLIVSDYLELEFRSSFNKYKLTPKGRDFLNSVFIRGSDLKPNWHLVDRSHNIKFTARIIRQVDDKNFSDWNVSRPKSWVSYSKEFLGVGVTKTTKSFTFQIPPAYYMSAKEAIANGGAICEKICTILEKKYKGLIIERHFVPSSQHHAIVGDPVAQFAKRSNVSLVVDGFEIDCSEYPESELTDAVFAPEDFEKYANNTISILKGEISPDIVNNKNILLLRDEIVKLKKQVQR